MGLDTRTIMVIFSMLTFMCFGLFELAGLHVGNIRGVRQWAIANLCISIGLSASYFYTFPTVGYDWAVVFGATFVAIGICLQYTGIQAFKEQRIAWHWLLLIVGVVVLQTIWFSVIHPDIRLRAIANSVAFAIVYVACARLLLVRIEPPLRTAYWFTGLSFLVLVLLMLVRAVMIWQSAPGSYGLYVNIPLNPLSFFIGSLVQLCVAFGFLLMLNYRLLMDLQRIASRDALTGAFNRRRLEEEATRLKARGERTGDMLAIMLIDIDLFKSINDRYGHPVGDEVLRRLANIAQTSIRADDYFARYGGDEFCILLPSTTEAAAMGLAERLRQAYAQAAQKNGMDYLNSTISIGVADSTANGLELSSLTAAADQALYRAKQQGRNQVVSYSSMS
ncbi:MAG: GGDEF domain-containing protein [Candidatus Methylopumilus sp.]|jgi:diguanylate cyclase (GGDEF)-like protein